MQITPLHCHVLWVIFELCFFGLIVVLHINHFCRVMGLQTCTYTAWSGRLSLLGTLLINAQTMYIFGSFLTTRAPFFQGTLFSMKPFLGLFFNFVVLRAFPFSIVLNIFYYLIKGPRIFHLLDSKCLGVPYQTGNPKIHFAFIMVINTMVIVAINASVFARNVKFDLTSLWQVALQMFSYYAVTSLRYFHLTALFYVQYSTLVNLRIIQRNLKKRQLANLAEESSIELFIKLAKNNQKLNNILSIPMINFYLISTLNAITIIYIVAFVFPIYGMLAYPLVNLTAFASLDYFQQKILKLVTEIVDQLKQRKQTEFRRITKQSVTKTLFRCSELELYVPYFQLKMYNLVSLNRQFYFGTGLFLVNYVVFIYQTK